MVHELCPQGAQVDVIFVRDADITELNWRHLRRQGPTNCLAFPDAGLHSKDLKGSLFVSLDTLHRECLLYGQSPMTHLGRLLAHGLVHLAGFDHGEEMDGRCASLEDIWATADVDSQAKSRI